MSPQFFPWIAAKLQDSTLPLVNLDRSVLAQGTLIDRYKFALDLNATDDRAPKGLREILFSTLDKVVYDCYTSTLYEQDGETLVFMACDRQDYDWLLRKLGPLLYKKRENFAFVMGFVWQFHVSARQDKLDVNDSFAFLKSTVRSLITRLDITRLVSVPGFQRWQQKRADAVHHNRGIIPPPPPPITSETLSNLCTILLDLDMQGDMDNLMRRLTEQSKTIDLAELFDLYLSFSRNLIDILAKRSKPFEDPVYSDLFRAVIFSLWNIYVGEAPAPEPALNLLHCGCWFCRDLHTFLTGPGEARGGFTFREYTIAAHADQVLHYAYSRGYCHYSRQQSGKTATWTVSKIPTKYENAKQNWDRRAEFARTQLRLFDQRQLSLLLGGDFSRIMGVPPPPEKPISIASSSPGYASAPEDPVPEDPQPDREQSQPPTGSRSPSAHVSSDRSSSTVPTPAISVQSPDTSSQMDNQTDTAPLPASSEQAALTPTSQNSGPDSGSGSSRYYSPPSVAGQKRKHPDDDTPTNSPSPSEEP
ncbi:hypothetical protein F5B20DRAFT_454663 [Whalleya microplaca]|nr:hypothetical protein F5B20DRAFT_454663 [Whalleya microplaca]